MIARTIEEPCAKRFMNEVIYRKSVLLPACTAVFCRFLKPSLEWLYQSGVPEPCCFVLFFHSYRGNGTMVQPKRKPLSLFAGADRTASWTISKLGNWGWAAVYQLFFTSPGTRVWTQSQVIQMLEWRNIWYSVNIYFCPYTNRIYSEKPIKNDMSLELYGTFYLSPWGI